MDKDSSHKAPDKIRQASGPSAAEASLTDALNGLEQILEQRQRTPTGAHKPDTKQANSTPADAQYTIPLLNDVVVPVGDGPPGQIGEHEHREALESDAENDEAYRKLAERLANEIEVIVQARVEAAVNDAAKDIREQVRNHLEIMLPEIIDELNGLGRR